MTPQEIEELSWRMGEVYEAVVNRILVNLARHFRFIEAGEIPSGAWEYQVKKLAEMGQINRETERIIIEMLGDADSALQALLEESILNGLRDAEPALRSAAEKGFLSGGSNIPPVLAPNQMQAFKAFYAQSADKLNLVNTVMLESTQAAFAATVSDIAVRIANTQGILNVASGEVVTGVSAWNKAMRDAVQKMVENGLTGYIDHAGRHWSPEAYVTMDIRSTMANTARAAVFERNEEYGNDLYQVSWHNGARPLCYPWQGKVISRTGNARVVEDDEGNEVQVHTEDEIESFNYGGGLFGVNCGHYPIPFIPNFSRIRQPMQDAEQNAKTYEESQKQRTLERKLRNEKRDLEVLKAQGASEDVLKEQRRRVRKASKDIDEFCAETGRARRRNREYTPIDPKFPDPDTYDPKLFPNDEKSKVGNWFRKGKDTDPQEFDKIPPMMHNTDMEAMRYYAKKDGQSYTVSKDDTVTLISSNREYGNIERPYFVKKNTTNGYELHQLPSAGGFIDGKYYSDETKATILQNGRIAITGSHRNDLRQQGKDIVENEIYRLIGVRQDGVFYRIAPPKTGIEKEIELIKTHKIRKSVNHATGQKEDGLSVWEYPKYGGETIKLLGKIISTGSDGEPILDINSLQYLGTYTTSKEDIERGKTLFAKEYEWTIEQVNSALNHGGTIIR